MTTRGATTNPSVPPAGGSWTAIKPSLQKHSDASSVREMLRAASPPPDLGMGEVGGVSLHWVNELPFSSIPHYGIKDMERTKTKAQQRSEEEEGQEEKAGAPRASDTSRGGGKGGGCSPHVPMPGLRHRIPAALQPEGGTCGRAGEIPGIAGIAAPAAAPSPSPSPPPPPIQRHQHSGSHPRAPTAGPSAPHSTAILRATSALRCPARPPPFPSLHPAGPMCHVLIPDSPAGGAG